MPANPPRPVALDDRSLGLDLARGVMLLCIAPANSYYFLQGSPVRDGYPQDGSSVDAAVTWLISTFVDGRAYVGAMLVRRAQASALIATLGPVGFACPFLVGLWVGRRRLLEQAEGHWSSCGSRPPSGSAPRCSALSRSR